MLDTYIYEWITILSESLTSNLLTLMAGTFVLGIAFRFVIQYTIRRELWFVKEFEKRVHAVLDSEQELPKIHYFQFLKRMLEKTYFEIFELRARFKRRNPDHVMSFTDRLFLVQDGSAKLVYDTLKQLRYLDHHQKAPKLDAVSKTVFNQNPSFSRVFGVIPAATVNSVLDILPSMFIISGIFGTFLGIMNALPMLGAMELADTAATKEVMDAFLLKIAFAMSSSIVGILLSVTMSLVNTIFDPESTFMDVVDRYTSILTIIWNRTHSEASQGLDQQFAESEEGSVEQDAEYSLWNQLQKKPLLNFGRKSYDEEEEYSEEEENEVPHSFDSYKVRKNSDDDSDGNAA